MSKDDLSDFATTKAQSRPRRQGSGPFVHGFAWLINVGLIVFVVPKLEMIFKDFGIELPLLTKLLVKASHLMFALVPAIALLMVVDGLVLAGLSRSGEVEKSRVWSILMVMIPLLVLALVVAGLFLPLISLISKLSG